VVYFIVKEVQSSMKAEKTAHSQLAICQCFVRYMMLQQYGCISKDGRDQSVVH
jgi:hypothetical protein